MPSGRERKAFFQKSFLSRINSNLSYITFIYRTEPLNTYKEILMKLCIFEKQDGIMMKVHITPCSKKDEITGLHDDALNIKLSAPAVDGKANISLISFLSESFSIKKRNIKIITGEKSRTKMIKIIGADLIFIKNHLTNYKVS